MITSGTDIIREAVRVRMVKGHLGTLARDLSVSVDALEAFVAGKRTLPPDILRALTTELLSHAEYDASCDRLRPANKQKPTPAYGVTPPPAKHNPTVPRQASGPFRIVRDAAPMPLKSKRPGWAD